MANLLWFIACVNIVYLVGEESILNSKKKYDVVVIGGSIAGCLAAAAAASVGAQVLILERDIEPHGAVVRKGTPQAHQLHTLLDGGRQAAEILLPGLCDDLRMHGSYVADSCADVHWFHGSVWKMRTPIGRPIYCQSRPMFEWRVREAVAGLGNVSFRFESSVDEPIFEDGAVRGVRLRSGEIIPADLTIDASGRGSALPNWLAGWGYGDVYERQVSLKLSYVSGLFTAPAKDVLSAFLMVYPEPPVQKRAGLVMRVEGDRCIVTLQGYHGEKPPEDIDGFREYARGLSRPELGELLEQVELLGELRRHNFPYQRLRAYAEMPRFPRGIVPIADAIASVDPAFGQGMSVAAMEALELKNCLAAGQIDQHTVAALTKVAAPAWLMTSTEAFRWPEASGDRPPAARVISWYADKVIKACADSENAVRAFYDVVHLTADLQSWARPDLLARILWHQMPKKWFPISHKSTES